MIERNSRRLFAKRAVTAGMALLLLCSSVSPQLQAQISLAVGAGGRGAVAELARQRQAVGGGRLARHLLLRRAALGVV